MSLHPYPCRSRPVLHQLKGMLLISSQDNLKRTHLAPEFLLGSLRVLINLNTVLLLLHNATQSLFPDGKALSHVTSAHKSLPQSSVPAELQLKHLARTRNQVYLYICFQKIIYWHTGTTEVISYVVLNF